MSRLATSQPVCYLPSYLLLDRGVQQLTSTGADITGPENATKAIVIVFDIFGYFEQTLQGADILAYSGEEQKYKVFMPDLFHGKPCPIEMRAFLSQFYCNSLTLEQLSSRYREEAETAG